MGSPEWDVKKARGKGGGKLFPQGQGKSYFLALVVIILKMARDTPKDILLTNKKLHNYDCDFNWHQSR